MQAASETAAAPQQHPVLPVRELKAWRGRVHALADEQMGHHVDELQTFAAMASSLKPRHGNVSAARNWILEHLGLVAAIGVQLERVSVLHCTVLYGVCCSLLGGQQHTRHMLATDNHCS